MGSIFLSYGREDAASARPIALALEKAGHSVWWDRHIKGGAQYSKEIDQALASAGAVLVLWSVNSIESPWVRDEAEAGRDTGRLVPACLDESRPPLGFRQYQTIDLRAWKRSSDPSDLEELLEAVSAPGETKVNASPIRPRKHPRTSWPTRRKVLAGAGAIGALGLAGGGALFYRRITHPPVPPEIRTMMLQAEQLMEQNTGAGQYQAIGLYERVVELMPDYADGWGRLGIAYAVPSHYRERPEALKLRAKAEAAGRRALQLDPDSVYGEMALAVALPFVGHWRERNERSLRALASQPRNDDLLTLRGVVLQFDGRPVESVSLYERIKGRPFTPAVYTNYIQALWSAGRLTELDQAMEDAAALYPTQWTIWRTRFNILSYDGRADAAVALLETPEGRPPEQGDGQFARLARLVRAIQSRDPAETGAIMAMQMDAAHGSAGGAEHAIRNASALGRLDEAFTIADAYYFNRGFTVPDFGEDSASSPEQRQTRLLFEPVTRPMRADPRFEKLVRDLSFDRYWRESGNQPDYRRTRRS
jgi:tetratricopeptide (TPR) repeat protein